MLAWVLTAVASLSTLLGAALILAADFFRSARCCDSGVQNDTKKPRGASPVLVAVCLALSAGAMMFVAVAELFSKSEEAFAEAGADEAGAKIGAVLSFFGGVVFMFGSNELVNLIAPEHQVFELSSYSPEAGSKKRAGSDVPYDVSGEAGGQAVGDPEIQKDCMTTAKSTTEADTATINTMQRLGLRTCLAIALHNFPEGLAAFVATMADGRSGLGIAFGVILHNVPEGLCVAAPIYFATGKYMAALGWAAVAGLAELLGGLTGYLLITYASGDADDLPPQAYGILFGAVNGIIVFICALGFLPAAAAFDKSPGRRNTTVAFCLGMAAIAITLVVEVF